MEATSKLTALDTNPLSPEAMEFEKTKRFSTPEDRAAMAAEIAALDRDGYVIVKDLISPDKVAEIRAAFDPFHAETAVGDTAFAGHQTQRVFNLASKTRVLDALFLHPKILAILEGHLDDQIQLSIASSASLMPGQAGQALHRDDTYYPLPRPHLPLSTNVMWAISDFTAENGGTKLVPGTHLTADLETPPDDQVINAEAPAGSAVLWSGSLFHGGGQNRSDAPRLGVTAIYSRAWLRQQENQFIGVPRELVKTLPRPLQKLLGYWVVNNFLGYVENGSPLAYLNAGE